MPPDRNAPKGTSDIKRTFTASRKISTTRSPASSSPIFSLFRKVWLPVTLILDFPFAPTEPMPGFQLSNCPVSGQRSGHTHERQVAIDRFRLNFLADVGMKQHGMNSEPNTNCPFTSAYRSGFLPTRSRARKSSWVPSSQIANANIPRRCFGQSEPYWSYAWTMASVSLFV